jgi:hypothetical protein
VRQVVYEFSTHATLQGPESPPVENRGVSRGTVWALNEEAIPEGHYELIMESGEIVHLKNVGFEWIILVPNV